MSRELAERLDKVLGLMGWVEDPWSAEGRRRLEKGIEDFAKLLEHPWLRQLTGSRRSVRVLDVCGGTGIGGVALAKALKNRGIDVSLTIVDLRPGALEKAEKLARLELGGNARTLVGDARELHRLSLEADLALLYGYSTPHFSPWDMVRFASSVASILPSDGVLLVEETDRIYNIFYRAGYKQILAERVDDEHTVLSLHSSYDVKRGMFKRMLVDLSSGERVGFEVHFWGLADAAAMLWAFFEDVDLVQTASPTTGFLVARRPRGIDPEQYRGDPAVLRPSP